MGEEPTTAALPRERSPLREQVLAGQFFSGRAVDVASELATFLHGRSSFGDSLEMWFGEMLTGLLANGGDRLRAALDRDIAELDAAIGDQLDALLRHPRFLALEGRWRGLPYGQNTDPTGAPSRRLTMIVAEKPAQSFAALHRPVALTIRVPRKQQDVALPLVVSLCMEMIDVFAQRPPQRALAEQDHLRQALLLDRPHPALRIGIQVRAVWRQRERPNPT